MPGAGARARAGGAAAGCRGHSDSDSVRTVIVALGQPETSILPAEGRRDRAARCTTSMVALPRVRVRVTVAVTGSLSPAGLPGQ
jgi:hypothetical protein